VYYFKLCRDKNNEKSTKYFRYEGESVSTEDEKMYENATQVKVEL
jgi:hypothetical protein